MSIESTILIENATVNNTYGRDFNSLTDSDTVIYSEKYKGAGYHKRYGSLHTLVYETDAFVGNIKIQATLALYPGENDWVDIESVDFTGDSTVAQSSNFTGNFVWIRSVHHIEDGEIISVRYNY